MRPGTIIRLPANTLHWRSLDDLSDETRAREPEPALYLRRLERYFDLVVTGRGITVIISGRARPWP